MKVGEVQELRQNLCKVVILNKCLEMWFIANKERQRKRKEIKRREIQLSDSGITCGGNGARRLCSGRPPSPPPLWVVSYNGRGSRMVKVLNEVLNQKYSN